MKVLIISCDKRLKELDSPSSDVKVIHPLCQALAERFDLICILNADFNDQGLMDWLSKVAMTWTVCGGKVRHIECGDYFAGLG